MQKIISELGSLNRWLKQHKEFLGSKIFVVCGKKSFEMSGAKQVIEETFDSNATVLFSDFRENPKIEDAIRGADIAKKFAPDSIIAIGGGSVLDMAKLIKAFYVNSGSELAIATGVQKDFVIQNIPILAVPTTAGSGSESTHFAVVYVSGEKYSLASKLILPDLVLLDGNLIKSASHYQKACSSLDALAQAIEGAWAKGSNEETRKKSFLAIRKLVQNIPAYVKGEADPRIFQDMIVASNLAGQVIDVTKTTAAHAWSYGITTKFNIPHGHAVWITLPTIFRLHDLKSNNFADKGLIDIIAKIKCAMRFRESERADVALDNFCRKLGIELDFEKLGIGFEERQKLSKSVNQERLKNNPIEFAPEDVKAIFNI